MRESRMYGLWDSPVTAKSLAVTLRLSEPCWDSDGRTLGWIEGRSDRGVLVVQEDGGAPRDLTTDISVRAFVGYGGGDFTLSHGHAYFVGQLDQRIYRQALGGGAPRAITPEFGAASTPVVSPDGRWLAYVHTYEDEDAICVVDVEGKQWPARLECGRDFYMQPTWHPSGERLAWVEWDHPNMPWDGTELTLGTLAFPEGGLPVLTRTVTVAGGSETAIFGPVFGPGGELCYTSDESGWGQVYRYEVATGQTTQVTKGGAEHGAPAWMHGMGTVAVTAGGSVVARRSVKGFERLVMFDRDGEELDLGPFMTEYGAIDRPVAPPVGERIAVVAAGGRQQARVLTVDLEGGNPVVRAVRRSGSETVRGEALSGPEAVSWTSFDGGEAHGLYFPPASARFEGSGGKPPLIVLVHGGPTSQVVAGWNAQAQFFATRGYAVLVPNYRGSTGYGREYMLKLRQSWGIYDVQDSKHGAQALVERGLVDGSKLVIMGGSAGGFTTLQSLVELPGFYKAGISLFGVANHFTLASDTHKFEARYLDSMLGPLPEAAAVYRERSPIFHADRIVDPVAVFQGDIDRVVPREQSDSIVASLRGRGIPHEYHVYEGEGHGWRKTETIEAFYESVQAFLKQYVLFG